MFNLAQYICYPGDARRANEDIVGWGKDYFFVMDGASCLSGMNIMGQGSDAAWMVAKVKDALCRQLDNGDPRSTGHILQEILEDVRKDYVIALQEQGLSQPDDSPSAGLALFRQREGLLEFFGLGDCVGVATLPDGSSFFSLDANLPKLDNSVLEEMVRIHKATGVPMLEARNHCREHLLENRKLRNHPDGYWILDLISDEGLKNARQFSWELTGPIKVGGFSDGFAQLSELFGIYDSYSSLFAAMQEKDLEAIYQTLCMAQDRDPDCNNYPRFKLRDDTCALWGTFQPN